MKADLILALLLLVSPAAARSRAPRTPPAADALLLKALAGPATGYAGLERIQVFRPQDKPKALTAAVFARPGGLLRREAKFGKRKEPGLVTLRDGRSSRLWLPAQRRLWSGPGSVETPEAGLARLRSLYELSVSTGGRVAKKTTWRVDLRTRGGSLRRSFWMDRRSGLILKKETYRPDGALSRRERFTKLELPADPPASLFQLDPPAGTTDVAWDPPHFPRWAPDGFMLVETRDSSAIYSDGASSVAFTEVPSSGLAPGGFEVVEAPQGIVLLYRSGDRTYRFEGDLAEDELLRMARSLEKKP